MKVNRLDHLVLTVRDIATTVRFYTEAIGMEHVEFKKGRHALRFGNQKINLHQLGSEFEPKARAATVGSADLSFITDSPLAEVQAHLQRCGIPIEVGPVKREGAEGPIESVYVRDPDGNLIELSNSVRQ